MVWSPIGEPGLDLQGHLNVGAYEAGKVLEHRLDNGPGVTPGPRRIEPHSTKKAFQARMTVALGRIPVIRAPLFRSSSRSTRLSSLCSSPTASGVPPLHAGFQKTRPVEFFQGPSPLPPSSLQKRGFLAAVALAASLPPRRLQRQTPPRVSHPMFKGSGTIEAIF